MIRAAEEEDLAEILKIQALCFKEPWSMEALESTFAHPRAIVQVVRDEEGVVGFTIALSAADECELLSVAVQPEYKRRGLGRRLCKTLEQHAHKLGARAIYLEVRASNEVARAFYVVMGYEFVAKRKHYYQDGEDALIMRTTLPEL